MVNNLWTNQSLENDSGSPWEGEIDFMGGLRVWGREQEDQVVRGRRDRIDGEDVKRDRWNWGTLELWYGNLKQ